MSDLSVFDNYECENQISMSFDNGENKKMKVHCLFEQSGTFKNEFIKLGHEAYDYDIQNEFGQTDYVIDLYGQIRSGYNGEPSIFDNMSKDDLIMAFFPCVRFENQIMLWFRGQCYSQKNWSLERKMKHCMTLQDELAENYKLVNMLFIICIQKGLRLIMENPYSQEHFLRRYWCYLPSVIDEDRRERGDYFKKPTQYWFLNIEPSNNLIMEVTNDNAIKEKDAIRHSCRAKNSIGMQDVKEETFRSLIHPDYANRFIREFIL